MVKEKLIEYNPNEYPKVWTIKKLKQIFLKEKMFEFKINDKTFTEYLFKTDRIN
jgi:hypothetical protein